MTFLNLFVYAGLIALGWIACEVYWTSIRTDAQSATHFRRDAVVGHLKSYWGFIKFVGVALLLFLVISLLSGCTVATRVVETLDKPVASAFDGTAESAEPVASATAVVEPTEVPEPIKVSEPIKGLATDLGARLCDADITTIDDPKKAPAIVVAPGEGLVISMDPGRVTAGDTEVVSSGSGILLGFTNDTKEPVTVTVTTGWNAPNGRWNTYICRFDGKAIAEQSEIKQDAEKKPVYKLVVMSDLIPVVTSATPAPNAKPASKPATVNCDSSGHWKGKLTVPAGCTLWVSSDAGGGTIDDTKYSYTEGYTLKVSGPAVVDITTPEAGKINHWMAPTATMTADKDGKNINVKWDAASKELVNR